LATARQRSRLRHQPAQAPLETQGIEVALGGKSDALAQVALGLMELIEFAGSRAAIDVAPQ
jgi:hypothetical protein